MKQSAVLKNFIRYVSLNILGMIGLSCYILADTFFIARGMGADGLTALNLAIPVFSIVSGIGLMIGMGAATKYAVLTAQSKQNDACHIFTHALLAAAFASALFILCGLFLSGPLSRLLGADSSTYVMTAVYLRTILCFAPAFILNNIMICFVRNDGAPNLSMAAMLTGSFSNIVLDYIFIFPLKMGMFGAALATGFAPVISVFIIFVAHIRPKKNHFRPVYTRFRLSSIRTITALGLSSLITELSSGLVIIIFNFVILKLEGNTGVAAYGIIANIALVATAIFSGISQGIQPLISHSYGAGQKRESIGYLKLALFVSVIFAAAIYAIAFIFPDPIIAAFNRDNDAGLALLAKKGLKIYFTGFLFAGINIIAAAYLNAMEQAGKAFLIAISRGFIANILFILILFMPLGMTGVWLSYPCAELSVFILSAMLLRFTCRKQLTAF